MPEPASIEPLPKTPARAARLLPMMQRAVQGLFAVFLVLSLATHSGHWRVGPFTWLPVVRLPALIPALVLRTTDQSPMAIGVLTLVPVLLGLSWPMLRLLEWRSPVGRRWQWGWAHITGPLAGLAFLGLASLMLAGVFGLNAGNAGAPLPLRNTAFQVLSLGVVWFVYLFIVNERPRLTWPLAIVVAIQGGVGLAQFALQRDIGLAAFGELALDPEVHGVSVLITDEGQRWLRAYGLTGHPNLLAALLALLLLVLLRDLPHLRGWRRGLLALAVGLGVLGLLATVSRAAWLAFGVGLVVWAIGFLAKPAATPTSAEGHPVSPDLSRKPRTPRPNRSRPSSLGPARRAAWILVPILAGVAFVAVYGRQLATRFFDLNTATEARSLFERMRDVRIAVTLIGDHPLTGVGLGNYLASARLVDRTARIVHNVTLLVTAELGVLGGILWVWIGLAPVVAAVREWLRGRRELLPQLGPWVAMLTIGMFHGLPWINTGWRTAILLALLMGDWVLLVQPGRQPPAGEPVPAVNLPGSPPGV